MAKYPLTDGTLGGDAKLDLYIYMGMTRLGLATNDHGSFPSSVYIFINQNLKSDSKKLKTVVAHEIYHAVQAAYKQIDLPVQGQTVQLSAWTANLGRIPLYFLDMGSAVQKIGIQDPGLRLYGGDETVRLAHEMILGIGGMKLLLHLGIVPGVIHLNEGHSAFGPVEYAVI